MQKRHSTTSRHLITQKCFSSQVALKLAVSAATLALAMPAQAATFTVSNTDDSGAGSLRDAVTQANNTAGADIIDFTTGAAAISLSTGELVISDDVTINAAMAAGVAVNAANSSRVFNITSGTTTINSLSVSQGTEVNGGCINVAAGATLALAGTSVSDCTATGAGPGNGGGGIFNAGTLNASSLNMMNNSATNGAGNGGAILNAPTGALAVTGSDSLISSNQANRAGGGIENNGGSVVLTNASMTSNSAVGGMTGAPGRGGAIHVSGAGTVTVNGGSFTDNTAGQEGAGLWNSPGGTITVQADDGTGTTFTNNDVTLIAPVAGETNRGGGALFNLGTMTVADATFTNNDANGAGANGGGVMNIGASAVLTVTDSTFDTNTAARAGGASETQGGAVTTLTNVTATSNTAGVNGGAVHGAGGMITINNGSYSANVAANEGGATWMRAGTMNITGSSMTGNIANGSDADAGGGAVFIDGGATSTITNATLTGNMANMGSGSGGGILADESTLTVTGGTISSNSSARAGGGIEARDAVGTTVSMVTFANNTTGPTPGNGGAIHITGTGNSDVTGSMFTGNTATAEGGGLWNSSGMATMTIADSTITGNTASGAAADQGGGGLFNNGGVLVVNNSSVNANVADGAAGSGGGILNDGGTLTVTGGSINDNTSVRAGGAVEDSAVDGDATTTTLTNVTMDGNSTGGSPGNGGATHVTGPGTITIDRSTVSNNAADNEGGGVWNHNSSTMNIYNSTISGNSSPLGGGVFTQNGTSATVNIVNATIAGNESHGIEAAGSNPAATINVTNTIVADNTGGGDIAGAVSANFSLIEDVTGATITGGNNVTGQDPLLAALADNGGDTQTQLVTSGPAIDAANNSQCSPAPISGVDQRNVGRPIDGNGDGAADCDIGAVEFADGPVATITATGGNNAETNATLGDDDVPAVSISYSNTSDESVTLTSVEGIVNGGRLTNVSKVSLLRDGTAVPADVSFNTATGAFVASLTGGQAVAANSGATFTVALSFDSANAGIGLLALAMLGLTMVWRRSRVLVAVLLAGSLSIACSSSDDEDDQNYSVTVSKVVATGDDTMAPVASPTLPVTGGNIRLEVD